MVVNGKKMTAKQLRKLGIKYQNKNNGKRVPLADAIRNALRDLEKDES